MEPKKDIETSADQHDEYLAHQEAELLEAQGHQEEIVEDDELKELLAELWQEECERELAEELEPEYTERDAFDDFYTDYANEMEG